MIKKQKTQVEIRRDILDIYEEIMWLAKRRNRTGSDARSWFTHVIANKLKRNLRQFTGKVSKVAVEDESAVLRLEHYERIQKTLTDLVARHLKKPNPNELVRTILKCERVHIVTFAENYTARCANGNYKKAGITLLPWRSINSTRQSVIWKKVLRGKVANDADYRPNGSVSGDGKNSYARKLAASRK